MSPDGLLCATKTINKGDEIINGFHMAITAGGLPFGQWPATACVPRSAHYPIAATRGHHNYNYVDSSPSSMAHAPNGAMQCYDDEIAMMCQFKDLCPAPLWNVMSLEERKLQARVFNDMPL